MRKLFTDNWVRVFHGLVVRGWGRVGAVGIACAFLGGL